MESGLAAVALYTGLNGLVLLALTANVGRVRGAQKVSIGDGGNLALIRAMRGQANFVELVPFTLLALTLTALLGGSVLALHILGAALTVGRILHAVHFIKGDAPGWQRMWGTLLTGIPLIAAILWLIVLGLF